MSGFAVRIAHTWDGQPTAPGERVDLGIALDADALWIDVDAPWHGDPAPSGPAGPRPALWEHEVVELFLLGPDEARRPYTEIELGPHGHHLLLRLEGVRSAVAVGLPVDWAPVREGDRWRGRARVDRALLPASIAAFNAYAIHGQGALRRYLAHAPVPGPTPDFHRLAHFPPWPWPAPG